MGLGWKFAFANSAIDTVLLVQVLKALSIQASYASTFSVILFVHFLLLAFYNIILWPKLLSPLRGLPEPTVSTIRSEKAT